MGKKDKKKVSGAVRTAAKTEKKLESKRKKELANIGEEDIESIIASIEKEESKREAAIETVVEAPSPRVSATFVPHPINSSELILFGGEHHDGKKTYVYKDLFIFNASKSEWRIIKAPGAPPPRSAHQAVALSSNKGELWIFGGEFTSVTEMQFYHYKDLWLYSIGDKKWQKVDRPGCPASRSGHRMTNLRRLLVLFGGYHDNGRSYKYYNDLYTFCTDNRVWKRYETSGIPPAPRSGCLLMPSGPNSLLVYGGYSRTTEGKVDKGITHGDLFRISGLAASTDPANPDASTTKATVPRWETLKGGVYKPTPPRNSFSACIGSGNKCYVFGGILDVEETEEQLTGELFNSINCLDLENATWRQMNLQPQKSNVSQEKKKDESMDVDEAPDVVTVCTDGVFTMTVSRTKSDNQSSQNASTSSNNKKDIDVPCPRMNAMIAVQKSVLYLYGGLVEKGEKQFTLSDMYTLDLHKSDGWKVLTRQTSLPEWFGSDSENDDDDESDSGDDDSEDESE